MSKKIGFISLGCAKNRVDSEKIMGLLKTGGFVITNEPDKADYIFINTCGFIESAKEESINTILEMAEYKKKHCKKLIVMGCLAQRYVKELKKELPEVDRFITLDEYGDLLKIFHEELQMPTDLIDPERLLSTDSWLGYLKIAEGCYRRCAYCAIPLIRGNYVSSPIDQLVDEATKLVAKGVKELVLVAQDTTMYGIDLYKKKELGTLILKLDKIPGIHWIRVLYLYPSEVDEELLLQLKKAKHFVPYFDLPLQYGNDRMLKIMNRKGTVSQFEKVEKLIYKHFPKAVLRTTMIVGFPTETDDDFQDLLRFIQKNPFDRLGAFTYSKEIDTPAYSMKPQVNKRIKEERLKKLLEVQADISQSRGERFIGKTLEVLIEGNDDLTGRYIGRSYASAPDQIDGIVEIDTSIVHKYGDFIKVRIKQANAYDLLGEEV